MFKAFKTVAKATLSAAGLVNQNSPRPYVQRLLGDTKMFAADVGAAGWLPPHWEDMEGGLNFLFFEPHPESYQKLVQRVKQSAYADTITVFQTALAGTSDKRTLHLLNTPTGSSLLPVNMESEFVDEADKYIFPITETQVDTRSLAEVLGEKQQLLHMLKLDVQGAELEILQGMGTDRLDELVMVESEVNMAYGGGHLGCPSFNDLKEVLNEADLRLYDVRVVPTYRKKNGYKFWYHENVFDVYQNSPSISGRVWEFDVMYFKDYRTLLQRDDVDQLRRLLVALCCYRFFNEAYFIVETCKTEQVIAATECDEMLTAILQWHNRCAKQFWYGRSKTSGVMRSLIGAS